MGVPQSPSCTIGWVTKDVGVGLPNYHSQSQGGKQWGIVWRGPEIDHKVLEQTLILNKHMSN